MLVYKTCRVCGNTQLDFSGYLGELPQINKFSKSQRAAIHLKKLPINLYFCEHCYHFQLGESFDPEETFRTYSYATQYTPSIQKHGERIVAWFEKKFGLKKNAFIVELASSDGAILRSFINRGYKKVLGVEPAVNIARMAQKNGIRTEPHFFSRVYAHQLVEKYGRADFVLARNVLAHVPETVDFLQGIRNLLQKEGVFCVEIPYARNLVDYLEFDSIYHEHVSYYLVTTLKYLFGRAGLEIIDIEETNMHTGSLAIFAKRIEGSRPVSKKVARFIEQERDEGYFKKETYRKFVAHCKKQLKNIRSYLITLKRPGGILVGYGAAAKANVLLNLVNIDFSLIDFMVDRSTIKCNVYSPGLGIIVKPIKALYQPGVDNVVLFAWNFADEIMMENKQLLEKGKKFHVLIPKPMRITPESLKKKNSFRFYHSLKS